MALLKQIEIARPGREPVAKSYHRIAAVSIITNGANIIEVASYTSEGKRDEEREAYIAAAETGVFPDIAVEVESRTFECPYDQEMTVDSAYAYLKSLPDFEGAEDIFEEAV